MEISKRKKFTHPLVLDIHQVEQLLDTLGLSDQDLSYSVDCSDVSALKPVSLEQVSSFPNPDNRSVEHIEISTRFGSERNPRIDIDFGYCYSSEGSLTYLISGEEHDVYAACAIVEDHVRTMLEKPPMSNGAARIVGGALAILGGGVLPMSIGVLIAKVQMLHKGHKTSMWPVYVMAVKLHSYWLGSYHFLFGAKAMAFGHVSHRWWEE